MTGRRNEACPVQNVQVFISGASLLQAFSELQVKMIDTQQKVKLADLQIDQLTRVQKIAKLTHTEITMLPDNTRLYEGVGRM